MSLAKEPHDQQQWANQRQHSCEKSDGQNLQETQPAQPYSRTMPHFSHGDDFCSGKVWLGATQFTSISQQKVSQFGDRHRWAPHVKHSVAVRANRDQVVDWINLVFPADFAEIKQVMDMNKASPYRAIRPFEIKATHPANHTVVTYTHRARCLITLECIYSYPPDCSFVEAAF